MSDYTSDVKSSQPDLPPTVDDSQKILVSILGAVAFSHCCNDFIQAMLPSIYPLLKTNFTLSYAQIGLITLIYQMTASLLQPWIGLYTDKHPKPWLLPSGMVSTLIGIGLLAMAPHFSVVLVASALIGVGSATFHPEASRVARMASGGRFGTAQSTFQVGGYIGTAFAPLVAAMLIIPHGQIAVGWLMIIALFAVIILSGISRWTVIHGHAHMKKTQPSGAAVAFIKGRQSGVVRGWRAAAGKIYLYCLNQ
ncbi:fosmidomycin/multidrug transport protein (MFS superfamily) [Pantoea ananatis LMG 5342]|nr:fosmidomycin/multidrug transport protein (MFS superfamily) [Pantoea ananatis LMG 5342]